MKSATQGLSWSAGIIGAFLACTAHAGDTITLKSEVYVKGPKVLLGEVAEIEGDRAEALALVEVAVAAMPGGMRSFNSALLLSRIRNAGIDTASMELKGSRVLATTLHLDITREMIAEDLRNFVETEMPWDPSQSEVEIVPPPQGFAIPEGEVEFRWRPNPRYQYLGNATFRGDILVDGRLARSFYGKVGVRTYGEVVVASRQIERNEPFSSRNLRLEKRELSTIASGAYYTTVDLDKLVAKTKLHPGQLVTERRAVAPTLVKRNQLVMVRTNVGSLRITSQAVAMRDAAAGDSITCRTLKSKLLFIGILQEDSTVIVP